MKIIDTRAASDEQARAFSAQYNGRLGQVCELLRYQGHIFAKVQRGMYNPIEHQGYTLSMIYWLGANAHLLIYDGSNKSHRQQPFHYVTMFYYNHLSTEPKTATWE